MKLNKIIAIKLLLSLVILFSFSSCSKQASSKNQSKATGWKINDKNDLAFDFNRSRDYDSINSKNGISRRAQLQWTSRRDLTLPGVSKPLPMRSYVRALISDNYNWSIGATSVTTPRVWAIQLGFTVSLF